MRDSSLEVEYSEEPGALYFFRCEGPKKGSNKWSTETTDGVEGLTTKLGCGAGCSS